jgi:toxin YoeB
VNVGFTPNGWADYTFWIDTDRGVLRAVNRLIRDITRDPFAGLGKPEPLKGDLSGWWSRRITQEHRLVYRVQGEEPAQIVVIAQCRHHYS